MSPRLLAILLAACSGGGPAPGAGEPRCRTLTAVTYNLRFDNPEDGPHRWSERADHVADQIHALAPDLLSFSSSYVRTSRG